MNTNQDPVLQGLLSTTEGTLSSIAQQYLAHYKDSISLFEAAECLSIRVMDEKTNYLERYIAIYLLLISYQEPVDCHPFVWTLLKVSATTEEPLERTMIADLLVNNEKSKYDDWELQKFGEEVEKEPELSEESEEIIALRSLMEAKYRELEALVDTRKETADDDTTVDFLRPFPDFIKISSSELHWLSPGIISDVEWDNTADIDRKLEKSRKLFNTALEKQLESAERQELLNSIDQDPHSSLHIGLKPEFLSALVNNNPYVAAAIIIKVAKYAVMQEYLEEFLRMPTGILLFDTMARIVKEIRIPQAYMVVFCINHMDNIINAAGDSESKRPLVCTILAFLQCMFENYIISPVQIKSELKKFMEEFSTIVDFGYFRQHLDKISQ